VQRPQWADCAQLRVRVRLRVGRAAAPRKGQRRRRSEWAQQTGQDPAAPGGLQRARPRGGGQRFAQARRVAPDGPREDSQISGRLHRLRYRRRGQRSFLFWPYMIIDGQRKTN